eukprot:gene11608-34313_t
MKKSTQKGGRRATLGKQPPPAGHKQITAGSQPNQVQELQKLGKQSSTGERQRKEQPQELVENALLFRVMLEGVGAAARSLGTKFTGKILRSVLVPTLERLGDPCELVQAAAYAALASICSNCGYGSLDHLVA